MPNRSAPSVVPSVVPGIVLAAILIAAFAVASRAPAPAEPVAVTVNDPSGPDMLSVFGESADKAEARIHAAEFAAICSKAATTVQLDAQRGEKQRLRTGLDLAEYRNDLRWYAMDGWSFASKYPRLKDAVSGYLDKTAGNSPKEMDEQTRAKWAAALLVMANNSQYAAENLK